MCCNIVVLKYKGIVQKCTIESRKQLNHVKRCLFCPHRLCFVVRACTRKYYCLLCVFDRLYLIERDMKLKRRNIILQYTLKRFAK
jgi:hypothetical protein